MPDVISMSGSSGHLKSQQGHSAQDQNPGTTNQNAKLLWMLVGKWCGPTCPSRQGIWQINKNVWQLLQGHAAAAQLKTQKLPNQLLRGHWVSGMGFDIKDKLWVTRLHLIPEECLRPFQTPPRILDICRPTLAANLENSLDASPVYPKLPPGTPHSGPLTVRPPMF